MHAYKIQLSTLPAYILLLHQSQLSIPQQQASLPYPKFRYTNLFKLHTIFPPSTLLMSDSQSLSAYPALSTCPRHIY